jgi:diguanylate cyclase (GGDEF)-like protein/PAS domain S-box-containing protein
MGGPGDHPRASVAALEIDPRAVLDGIPGVVAVISAGGEVIWVNDSMAEVTGYARHELIGSNILDHLDVEWNPVALESIEYALATPGMRLPTMLRFHTKLGRPVVMEVTANNQLDDPEVRGLIVHLRPSDERQLLDAILESHAAGDDLAATMRCVHQVVAAETLRADAAVVLADAPGDLDRVYASSPTLEMVCRFEGPTTPWAEAAAREQPVLLTDLARLPAPVRAIAEEQGYAACWALPISRAGTPQVDAVLVVWRREQGLPEPSATILCARLVRLCELILERVEHARVLAHAAAHDPLTDLANREGFFASIDEHLAVAGARLGVLYLDLDGFKPINDRWGHAAGDQVLRAVADRMRASVRGSDTVARLGGDEFAIACPGADEVELIRLAERLLAVIRAPITAGDDVLRVGSTVGLASCRAGSCSGDVLVAAADAALLAAKAEAKGTWRAADPRW